MLDSLGRGPCIKAGGRRSWAHETVAVEFDFESLERVGRYAGDDGAGGGGEAEKDAALDAAVSDEVGGG